MTEVELGVVGSPPPLIAAIDEQAGAVVEVGSIHCLRTRRAGRSVSCVLQEDGFARAAVG